MNRVGLEAMVADRVKLPKGTVSKVLSAIQNVITEQLAAGEDVRLVGFGSFTVRKRNARPGKNPKTGEAIDIPASKKPVFSAGKSLKIAVNAD